MPCEGCGNQISTEFCTNICCLKYFCDNCWRIKHSAPGMASHKPVHKTRSFHSSKTMALYQHTIDETPRFMRSLTPGWKSTELEQAPAWPLTTPNLENLTHAAEWPSTPRFGIKDSPPSLSFGSPGKASDWLNSRALEDHLDKILNWPALPPFGSSNKSLEGAGFVDWNAFDKNFESKS